MITTGNCAGGDARNHRTIEAAAARLARLGHFAAVLAATGKHAGRESDVADLADRISEYAA